MNSSRRLRRFDSTLDPAPPPPALVVVEDTGRRSDTPGPVPAGPPLLTCSARARARVCVCKVSR